MKKISIKFISAAMAALIFIACKPTEQGYKAAYDAAKLKRESAARERMIPASGLLSDEGPQLRVVEGDSVYVLREPVRRADGSALPTPLMVAVGVFKMQTNADASAEDLRKAGWPDAATVLGQDQKCYTIVANVATFEEACSAIKRFRTQFPDYPYIGLPANPVVLGAVSKDYSSVSFFMDDGPAMQPLCPIG
ncbi:MAG: hypothetical protein NC204_00730 [Candidatus Amulumruptor caecigallinarius]|nr:hypothetical protein [Candidatus Amulumruptor caecigallinarius]